MKGGKPLIDRHSLRPDRREKPVPGQSKLACVELETELVVSRLIVRVGISERSATGKRGQPLRQETDIVGPSRAVSVEFVELGQEHGGLQLGQWADVVAAVKAEASAVMQLALRRQDGAAAAGAQKL